MDLLRGVILPEQDLGHAQIDLLPEELVLHQVGVIAVGQHHRKVHLPVGDLLLQVGGQPLHKAHLHPGVLLLESRQNDGQELGAPGHAGPKAQGAPLLVLHVGEDVLQIPLLLPHHLGKGQHELPRAGEGQGGLPVKQLGAVILLQTLDVVAQGLLRDVQPLRGLGHVQILGQLLKVVQTDQIHRRPPPQSFFVEN